MCVSIYIVVLNSLYKTYLKGVSYLRFITKTDKTVILMIVKLIKGKIKNINFKNENTTDSENLNH